MIRKIIRLFLDGIAFSCVILVIIGLALNLGIFVLLPYFLPYFFDNFAVYALASFSIGVAFSVSTIVYDIDALALWLKIAINIFIGFGTVFLAGFYIGVISVQAPITIIFAIVANTVIFILSTLGSYLLDERDAKKINAKLKELEIKRQSTEQPPDDGHHKL